MALRDDLLLLNPLECKNTLCTSRNWTFQAQAHNFSRFLLKNSLFFLTHIFLFYSLVFSSSSRILSSLQNFPNPPFSCLSPSLKPSTYPLSHSPRTPHLHSHHSPYPHFPYSLHYVPHYWSKMCKTPDIVVGDQITLPV